MSISLQYSTVFQSEASHLKSQRAVLLLTNKATDETKEDKSEMDPNFYL